MSGRHVLITGGAGFIGSHLVERLLAGGDRITVLDNFNDFYDPNRKRSNVASHLERPDFTLVEGDIRDQALVDELFARARFDAVVHLAARAGVRPSLEEPVLYEDVNCIGTLRLLEAARRYGPDVFIFGSSSSVYGINEKVPFAEDDPVEKPISPYATTKRTGELICYNYHHLYGLKIACMRFFTVYGPRQRPEMAIHKFTDMIARGEAVPMFGDGGSRRDYTYIDDIVDGLERVIELAPEFEILNLGGAETTRLSELIAAIGAALAVVPRIQYLPAQPGDVPITFADIEKAHRLLGYEPKVPIKEGIGRFVDWYLAQSNGTQPAGTQPGGAPT